VTPTEIFEDPLINESGVSTWPPVLSLSLWKALEAAPIEEVSTPAAAGHRFRAVNEEGGANLY